MTDLSLPPQDAGDSPLPPSLAQNPRLASWITIGTDGTVTVRSGKVELGQGIVTALGQLAADELEVDVARIRIRSVVTALSPNEGYTAASRSIEESGPAIRQVCAEVRALFLACAAEKLATDAPLRIDDGTIVDDASGDSTTYWALAPEVSLERDATGGTAPRPMVRGNRGTASVPRLDLLAKLTGSGAYLQDMTLPGMLHGRVVRPPEVGSRLESVDWEPPPGTVLARDGSFLGVVAEREEDAIAAAEQLAAATTWTAGDGLPDEADLAHLLRTTESSTEVLDHSAEPPGDATQTLHASYFRPLVAHASIGPSCAVAQWTGTTLRVWCSSQGAYFVRTELARCFDMELDDVVVEHVDGSGCYGHNGSDDAAYEAALLARVTDGRPVRLQWTRADELAWPPFGPPMAADVEASLDANGSIARWTYDVWSAGHLGRPGVGTPAPNFLAASQLADPFDRQPALDVPMSFGGGAGRNAVPIYDVGVRHIEAHVVQSFPLRTSSLRSLGAHLNVFAVESFMDELALAAGIDPVEFRLRHLADDRGRAVIERAVVESGYGTELPDGCARGLGFARYKNKAGYCAVVAQVEAVDSLRVTHLTAVADVGFAINPDGVANQVSGGAIQSTSWTLLEAVRFDRERVTSTDWETYPILRFSEVPEVRVTVLDRPDDPPLGAGEISQPTAAAIGNAVFSALGVRIRDLPITYERIVDALNA